MAPNSVKETESVIIFSINLSIYIFRLHRGTVRLNGDTPIGVEGHSVRVLEKT